jgi:protein TonB
VREAEVAAVEAPPPPAPLPPAEVAPAEPVREAEVAVVEAPPEPPSPPPVEVAPTPPARDVQVAVVEPPPPAAPRLPEVLPAEPARAVQTAVVEPPQQPAPSPPAEIVPPPARELQVAVAAPRHPDAEKPVQAAPIPQPRPDSAGSNSIGAGRSTIDMNYIGRTVAHLRRHQRYPAEARNRREQGKAVVTFGLDRDGRVNSVRLVSSSGSRSLDREAQAWVQRASPFPPPPGGQPTTLTVPLAFSLAR